MLTHREFVLSQFGREITQKAMDATVNAFMEQLAKDVI